MSKLPGIREGIDTSTSWGKLEYTNWCDENLSWKKTCYIGDWSYLDEFIVEGGDALQFLSDFSVNSLAKYDVGQAKHTIFCNNAGKVIGEGILQRHSNERFEFNARGPVVHWLMFKHAKGGYRSKVTLSLGRFKFQVSGPNALAVCEKVTQGTLRDIAFMHFRGARIAGHQLSLLRQGMAGEIGFEIHGPGENAEEVRTAILEAGQEFGIRQLGSRTAMINHLEAAFPTITHDYLPAVGDDAERDFYSEYQASVGRAGSAEWFRSFARSVKVKGSFDSSDVRDWYRSPVELGWAKNIKFDHEFYGRAALEAEMLNPRRTRVALVWNKQDVIEVYASLFEEDEPYDFMEMPRHQWFAMYANAVFVGDRAIGVATSRGYSYYFRKMLSHCVIEIEYGRPGTEVEVLWGDPGSRQMRIRAVVAPSPFKTDNRRADLTVGE